MKLPVKLPSGKSLSTGVVAGVMLLGLVWFMYAVLPRPIFIATLGVLLYEVYTLINEHPQDTISESIWRLNRRPLVPMGFGFAIGVMLAWGFMSTWVCAAVGVLFGHFFWQRGDVCSSDYEGKKGESA